MGEMVDCPLCCGSTFDSKESLTAHLATFINILCPICHSSFNNVSNLIEHLNTCTTIINKENCVGAGVEYDGYETLYVLDTPMGTQVSSEYIGII